MILSVKVRVISGKYKGGGLFLSVKVRVEALPLMDSYRILMGSLGGYA
jgi:hypothetical protein